MEIIQRGLFIVVVTTISEGVNCCDLTAGRILRNSTYTPSIVGVSCNCISIFVNNGDYITLQILDEVVGNRVVNNTANAVLVIVKRNESIAVPSLAENLGSVKSVGVLYAIYCLTGTNTICIVGVGITIKRLKLTSLFPSQRVTEVRGGVTLSIISDGLTVITGEKVLPLCITVEVTISPESSISASVARTILPSSYS